jgi:hypothetical protein
VASANRHASVIRRVLSTAEPSNRLLRIGLGVLALLVSLGALVDLLRGYPRGVDLEIALRAAERWMAGGQPYLAEAFAYGPGYDLPYLYPPYALPLFAPLTVIDRGLLHVLWFGAGVLIAYATCRRLGIQRRWIPALLVWPPFAEALISGNVQTVIFGAFVALLVDRARHGRQAAAAEPRVPLVRGLLITATTFLKVSQPHVLVHLAPREKRAVIVAVAAIALLTLATLPLTGTALWFDWIAQLRRAADPNWALGGPSLSHLLPAPLGLLIVIGCLLAVLAVPRAAAAVWVGALLVVGATSLHTYYLLFLLPAMLQIRREIALLGALLIATYTEPGWWIAIAIVVGALALSRWQPGLLEGPPDLDRDGGAAPAD